MLCDFNNLMNHFYLLRDFISYFNRIVSTAKVYVYVYVVCVLWELYTYVCTYVPACVYIIPSSNFPYVIGGGR